jgi:hypothetical protein
MATVDRRASGWGDVTVVHRGDVTVAQHAEVDGVSAAAVLRMLVHQHLMTAQATAKPRKVAKRAVKRGGK